MPIERARFIKIMMLAQSTNDKEALAALRKANAMLAAANLNWEEFINGGVRKSTPMGRGTSSAPRDNVERFTDSKIASWLDALDREVKGGFRDFIISVSEYWKINGYLTKAQYEAIRNAYDRLD